MAIGNPRAVRHQHVRARLGKSDYRCAIPRRKRSSTCRNTKKRGRGKRGSDRVEYQRHLRGHLQSHIAIAEMATTRVTRSMTAPNRMVDDKSGVNAAIKGSATVTKDSAAAMKNSVTTMKDSTTPAKNSSSAMKNSALIMKDSTTLTIPVIEGIGNHEPRVGMEFDSDREVYSFYNEYARRAGFGITTRYTRYSKRDRTCIFVFYVCSRYGIPVRTEKTNKARIRAKVDCKAGLKAKKNESRKWEIVDFIKEHKHELSPGHVRFFRSHKKASSRQRNAMRSGVGNDSGFMGEGYRNHVDIEPRNSLLGEDAQTILGHFMHLHISNPAFFYAVEVDEGQHMRCLFWAEGRSRTAYTYFGDVVTFDTKYLANKYSVPLASFVGVNHHEQPVLLGCALLADETIESFVWVFKTWLRAMSGQPPKAIITDDDKTIQSAVEEAFPESCHRLCLSHILKKVPEKLGHVCTAHPTFVERLHKCAYDSLTADKFEKRWDKMIKEFQLEEDTWLQTLYGDRQKWAPAYLKDTFFAGMSISQRGDCLNSFFDGYVSAKTTLKEFAGQYEIALENSYEKEAQADFETLHTMPPLKTSSPFEKQAVSLYTRGIFKKFQDEVSGMHTCQARIVQQQGDIAIYIVKEWKERKMKVKDYEVTWKGSEARVSCVCHLYEFRGFLCRHALTVLVAALGEAVLPSHYILRRWTKDMRNRNFSDQCSFEDATQDDHPTSMGQRYSDLCQRCLKFAEEGSLSEETYKTALHELQKGIQKLVIGPNSFGGVADEMGNVALRGSKTKRGRKAKRQESAIETPTSKTKRIPRPANLRATQESWHHMFEPGASDLANQRNTQESWQQVGQYVQGVPSPPSQRASQDNWQMGQYVQGVPSPGNQRGIQDSWTMGHYVQGMPGLMNHRSAQDTWQMGQFEQAVPTVANQRATQESWQQMGPLDPRTWVLANQGSTQGNLTNS